MAARDAQEHSGRPVAFITGAAGGIGRAIAAEFSSTHDLVLADFDIVRLGEAASEIKTTGKVMLSTGDITEVDYVADTLAESLRTLGPVSTVIACAGIDAEGTAETCTVEDWHKVLDVNTFGTFLTAKFSVPQLRETQGSFIAIASDAGVTGAQGLAAYVASKHAVVGLIKSMAVDFGPYGVRSNAICPGFVETQLTRNFFKDALEGTENAWKEDIPLGRFGQPQEIASIARHLSQSGFANGMSYVVDGGATAGYFSANLND